VLLSVETRHVGRVSVMRCRGRIIAGSESEWLHSQISQLLVDQRAILLHFGDVTFLDSSGLGALVRALNNSRQARAELKLCNLPPHVRRVLELTCLNRVFELHETEEGALESFYHSHAEQREAGRNGRSILCFGTNINLLAYLREVLHRAGYEVQTASLVSDARLLMRVTPVDLILIGAEKSDTLANSPAFRDACARIPIVELDREFATRCAGEAGTDLLALLEAKLKN
jgi:anti-sigma B factor antagonist